MDLLKILRTGPLGDLLSRWSSTENGGNGPCDGRFEECMDADGEAVGYRRCVCWWEHHAQGRAQAVDWLLGELQVCRDANELRHTNEVAAVHRLEDCLRRKGASRAYPPRGVTWMELRDRFSALPREELLLALAEDERVGRGWRVEGEEGTASLPCLLLQRFADTGLKDKPEDGWCCVPYFCLKLCANLDERVVAGQLQHSPQFQDALMACLTHILAVTVDPGMEGDQAILNLPMIWILRPSGEAWSTLTRMIASERCEILEVGDMEREREKIEGLQERGGQGNLLLRVNGRVAASAEFHDRLDALFAEPPLNRRLIVDVSIDPLPEPTRLVNRLSLGLSRRRRPRIPRRLKTRRGLIDATRPFSENEIAALAPLALTPDHRGCSPHLQRILGLSDAERTLGRVMELMVASEPDSASTAEHATSSHPMRA